MYTNKVRHYREILKLTQRQLAEKIGTYQTQVQRVEIGQNVSLATALAICKVLGQDLTDVFPHANKFIGTGRLRRSRREHKYWELLAPASSSETDWARRQLANWQAKYAQAPVR